MSAAIGEPSCSMQFLTHNVAEVIACLVTGVRLRRDAQAHVSPVLQPWVPQLLQHQNHPAFGLTTALLALGVPVKDLMRFAFAHEPLPKMVELYHCQLPMLTERQAGRLGQVFRLEGGSGNIWKFYAEAVRDFWCSTGFDEFWQQQRDAARLATAQARNLTSGVNLVAEVASALDIVAQGDCLVVPILCLADHRERYGFTLATGVHTKVVVSFGFDGFADSLVEGKSRQWLRLGCYHHIAQALLHPIFEELMPMVQSSQSLLEPLQGLPVHAEYKNWHDILSRQFLTAVVVFLERRRFGPLHADMLTRLHPGSGMLYASFLENWLAETAGKGMGLPQRLRDVAARLDNYKEEIRHAVKSLPFKGSIKECRTPYWLSNGRPVLMLGGEQGEQADLHRVATVAWGELVRVHDRKDQGPRPLVYYGGAFDLPAVHDLLREADIAVTPRYIRVQQSTYYGDRLQIVAVGRSLTLPSQWWAIHCAWHAGDVSLAPSWDEVGSDYLIFRDGVVIGAGDYIVADALYKGTGEICNTTF